MEHSHELRWHTGALEVRDYCELAMPASVGRAGSAAVPVRVHYATGNDMDFGAT